jgi:hypothetical protein
MSFQNLISKMETKGNAFIPDATIRTRNRVEVLLESGRFYSSSIQPDPTNRYLLARRTELGSPWSSTAMISCVYDLEETRPLPEEEISNLSLHDMAYAYLTKRIFRSLYKFRYTNVQTGEDDTEPISFEGISTTVVDLEEDVQYYRDLYFPYRLLYRIPVRKP